MEIANDNLVYWDCSVDSPVIYVLIQSYIRKGKKILSEFPEILA